MNTLKDDLVVFRFKAKNIVENFLDLGLILKGIKDGEKWKEKGYDNFKHCILEEQLASEGFAYKLIKVVEDPQLTSISKKLGISKTLELIYAPVEEREEIAEKTEKEKLSTSSVRNAVKTVKKDKFFKEIHRKCQREDAQIAVEGDSELAKGHRIGLAILQDLISIKVPISDLYTRKKNYEKNFKHPELSDRKREIDKAWIELRSV